MGALQSYLEAGEGISVEFERYDVGDGRVVIRIWVPMVAAEVPTVSERTVRRHIGAMEERGALVKEGKGKATRYRAASGNE